MPSKRKPEPTPTLRDLVAQSGLPLKEAEDILARLLRTSRTYVLAHPEFVASRAVRKQARALFARRRIQEPVAYLFGEAPFCGHTFCVTKDTLIPRPETEWLVAYAQEQLQRDPTISRVIDVGTGAGGILLATFRGTPAKQRTNIAWIGIDCSPRALVVAKKNARTMHCKNIRWLSGNLLEPLAKDTPPKGTTLLLANLPYLPTHDMKSLPASVRQFEPHRALAGGNDGLRLYRKLVRQYQTMPGQTRYCFEIDPCHATVFATLMRSIGTATVHRDFQKKKRYLVGTISTSKF